MNSTRPRHLALLLAALALVASSSVASAACDSEPAYSALDRWLGEWRLVSDPDREPEDVGRTQLRRILGGCAVEEVRRLNNGSEQRALGLLDPASGEWRQHWVTSDGDTGSFAIAPAGETLRIEGTIHLRATGQEFVVRSVISPRDGGGFDERLELSADGGESFELQPATAYLPLAAALPRPPDRPAAPAAKAPSVAAPAAPPAPAQTPPSAPPAASSPSVPSAPAPSAGEARVQVRSGRKADAPVLETAMLSPMTLELELGPLDALPPGASWRTTELEPYVVETVSMPRVTAGTRERRGKTLLELTVNLLTRSRQVKVDLEAELLSDGATIATVRGENITLGKLIMSHDPETGLPYSLLFELEPATFADLFADARRPSVRLTLTVR